MPAPVLQEDRLRPREGMGTTKVTQRVPGGCGLWYGWSCVPPERYFDVLTPSISECDLSGNSVVADVAKMRSYGRGVGP